MAVSEAALIRLREKRIYLIAAILLPIIVLIGFGPTYYYKPFMTVPPLSSYIVHIHGAIMTAWVTLFIAQVFLVRTKNIRVHQSLGYLGIALGVLVVIAGFFTAIAAAKNGTPPPGFPPPLSFLAIPFFDLITFSVLFAAAIYYRKRPANHRRLMLVLAISLLPPAVARIALAYFPSPGPLYFFGLPTVLCLIAIFYDRWQNGKFNPVMIYAVIFLVATYPLRLIVSGTDAWIAFANWLTGFSPI